MSDTIINLGFISIKWYSVLILIGVIIAMFIIIREAKRYDYSSEFVFNLLFWTIIVGIIGARLYYVVFNYEMYNNFSDIFKVWEGGLAIHGGIIFGTITAILYCKRYKVRTIRMVDFMVPGMLIAQAIGRWGNFFNQEAHGSATTLEHLQSLHIPNFVISGMNIDGIYYHPTFLYESLACFIGFIIILIIRRFRFIKVSQPTAFYLIWYGVIRFFIESLRTDSLMLGGFKAAQIVSIIMIIIGIILLINTFKKKKYEDLYNKSQNQQLKI